MLRTGTINHRKSDPKLLPCPKLVVDARVGKNVQARRGPQLLPRAYTVCVLHTRLYTGCHRLVTHHVLSGRTGSRFCLRVSDRRCYCHRQGHKLGMLLPMTILLPMHAAFTFCNYLLPDTMHSVVSLKPH